VPSSPSCRTDSLRTRGFSWQIVGGHSLARGHVAWVRIEPAAGEIDSPHGMRDLLIEETGDVPEVRVTNSSFRPVLLQSNLVVTGGLQTRAILRSLVVPARGATRAPVRCVEQGRWAPRDDGGGATFGVGGPVSLHMRTRMTMYKAESLRAEGAYGVDQRTVWREVEAELARSKVASSTRSYEAYLDGARKRDLDAVDAERIRPPENANGLLARPRAGGFWLEAFPSHAVLARQAAASIADLVAPDPEARPPGSVPAAEALMERIWTTPLRPIEAVPSSTGDAYALAEVDVAGEILLVGGRLAHLAVGAG